jgi:serine/threonine protein kinase
MGAKEANRMTIVYTPGYAPPEQVLGKPEPRSDLFALAAMLYQLTTGKEPHGHHTAAEIEALLNDPAQPIAAEQRWFFELLRINLAEDPNDRYFSAAEFKADLERRCVTKEVCCATCQAVNPVRQPYCRQCAIPMTTAMPPCHHCGRINRLGSRWCIHCGNRLP